MLHLNDKKTHVKGIMIYFVTDKKTQASMLKAQAHRILSGKDPRPLKYFFRIEF